MYEKKNRNGFVIKLFYFWPIAFINYLYTLNSNLMTLFLIISTIIYLLVSSMIFLKTPINTTLLLATTLLLSTLILFIFHVEFLSYIFILVYVGGIAILFLFVIIMLNIKVSEKNSDAFSLFSSSALLFLFTLKLQSYILTTVSNTFGNRLPTNGQVVDLVTSNYINELLSNDIRNFGLLLYTHYFYYFFLSGVILLLAMVGVLVLSLNNTTFKNF